MGKKQVFLREGTAMFCSKIKRNRSGKQRYRMWRQIERELGTEKSVFFIKETKYGSLILFEGESNGFYLVQRVGQRKKLVDYFNTEMKAQLNQTTF